MTRATIRGVNKRIAKYGVELVRGPGYFYFMDLDDTPYGLPEVDSVYVYTLTSFTVEQWVSHVESFRKEIV